MVEILCEKNHNIFFSKKKQFEDKLPKINQH